MLQFSHCLLPSLALISEQTKQIFSVLQSTLALLLLVSEPVDEVSCLLQISLHILDVLLDLFDLLLHFS